jgi:hypothetical protein
MATTAIILVGAVLVAAAIAMEAGVLRLPTPRGREPRSTPDAPVAQCVATTAGGDRCVRPPVDRHSHYCWQHHRMAVRLGNRGAQLASAGAAARFTRR